eukprot:c3513_g1_i2.p2 GENE.c3513_g1_i2~~c3513_g1_i2.p2  ORF type:complete len:190 (-),score=52.61 c3513_g1_i2:73-642(-)
MLSQLEITLPPTDAIDTNDRSQYEQQSNSFWTASSSFEEICSSSNVHFCIPSHVNLLVSTPADVLAIATEISAKFRVLKVDSTFRCENTREGQLERGCVLWVVCCVNPDRPDSQLICKFSVQIADCHTAARQRPLFQKVATSNSSEQCARAFASLASATPSALEQINDTTRDDYGVVAMQVWKSRASGN